MTASAHDVRAELETIFQDVFNDPHLTLSPGLTADDVDEWDSLAHISLMYTIEQHYGIAFTDAQMTGLADVDELVGVVEQHLSVR